MPITCTQTRIHHTQSLHYDKLLKRSSLRHTVSLQRTSLQRYIVVIYRLLCEISLQRSLATTKSRYNDISARYREDCTDISMIYRFNVRQSMQCFADISAINRKEKARYSSIIVCITFAQYCSFPEHFPNHHRISVQCSDL